MKNLSGSCTIYAKNIGQVVTNFMGHVDTAWDTKQVYTSYYQYNIKVKIKSCDYSWSKSLELIKMQPKKVSNVA